MNTSSPPKNRLLLGALIAVLVLLLLFFLSIPTLISSDAGTRFIVRMVENKTGGQLFVKDLSLGWFSDQEIEELHFIEKGGGSLQFDHLTSSVSFWNLIFRSGSIGTTRIQNPKMTIPSDTQVKTPSEKEKKETPQKEKVPFWDRLSGHLIVNNGSIQMLQGIELDVILPSKNKISSLSLSGTSTGGSFSANGTYDDIFVGNGSFNNFPVSVLDYFIALFKPKYEKLVLAALGNTLNGSFSSTKEGMITLSVRTPRLFVDLSPTYKSKTFVFGSGGRCAWTIKPEVFNTFSQELLLETAAQNELEIESATLSLESPKSAALEGTFSFSDGVFLSKKVNERIAVQSFTTTFSTDHLEKGIALSLRGTLSNAALQGSVSIGAPLDEERSFPSINLNIDDFPLSLLDSLTKQSTSTYLGKTFSGKIQKSDKALSLSGQTPLLQLSPISLSMNGDATLTSPSSFEYLVTPALYEGLARDFPIKGTLNQLRVPLEREALALKDASFDLSVNAGAISFKDLLSLGGATLPNLRATLKGTSLEDVEFKGSSPLQFQEKTLGESIFGRSLSLNLDAVAKVRKEFEISPLNLTLDGAKFKGRIEAAIEKNLFLLKKALSATLLLEPDQINPILAKDQEYPLLTNPTPLTLEIKPSQIPLKGADLSALSIQGKGTIATLSMVNPSNRYPFEFKEVELDFDVDGKKKHHTIRFEGQALEDQAAAGKLSLLLQGTGKIGDLIKSPSLIRGELSDFSSQIADVFFKTRGQLPDMVGEMVNLSYIMEKSGEKQTIDLSLKSPHLTLDGSFIAAETLELRSPRKPLKIHWDLTEQGYDAYRRWRGAGKPLESNNALFTIMGTGKLNISVAPFSVPLKERGEGFPKPDFNLYGSRFDASLRIDDLKLRETRSGAITELRSFDFDLAKPSVGNTPLAFKFNGNVIPQGRVGQGKVQGTGKLQDFLSPAGTFDPSNVTTEIHAQIKNLPSVFADALSKLDTSSIFPPSAVLGDQLNASFDAEIKQSQGKVAMHLDASACKASFNGFLSNGVLYLNEPLKAIFTITPQLNEALDKAADLIVVAMEKPITLDIHDEGFQVPLKNLHIRNMNFNFGQLDLGQIIVKDVGSAEDVSSLFKMNESGNKSIWFAPAIFNMKGGKMYVDRTEILYNKAYQVCLWGQVKFPSRKVDMTLGLTAQALRAALGIQGIDDNYVLKVPVRGPFGNVKIDKGAGASKIAFLLARKHLAPQTGIFGQVLGAAIDLADDQSDVPPPRPPFPWQGS
ncbi:MAG: hypothetical protein H7A38_03185 [Chlamydiales bacterium]|nr:hypothetical protein [Chlamydiales bacterium]